VQRQLAHAEKDKIRAAYLRTDFWDCRVKMMAYWCDLRSFTGDLFGDDVPKPGSGTIQIHIGIDRSPATIEGIANAATD